MRVEDQSGHIHVYAWTKIDCLKSLHQGTYVADGALSVFCNHLAYSDTQEGMTF